MVKRQEYYNKWPLIKLSTVEIISDMNLDY